MDEINTTDTSVILTEAEQTLLDSIIEESRSETTSEVTRQTIPLNSASLLVDETSSRFSSATWFTEIGKQTVTLAGVGGIGSYCSFLLGRLKINRLILIDDDIVDSTNLSGQLFSVEHIGLPKVSAASKILRQYACYYNTSSFFSRITPDSNLYTKIVICGFDNMTARKDLFNLWKLYVYRASEDSRKDYLFIDGRLAAEEFQVFCIKGNDMFLMNKYEEEHLFSDEEAGETLCSYKQTSFCANMIASIMVNLFVNFVANKCDPLIERELPFYTCYDAERMILKTESV